MASDIKKPINAARLKRLPEEMCRELKNARLKRGWSQLELGQRIGSPQMHISNIETGKISPRFDTLIELVRTLGYDLIMVPRSLVPTVQSLVRDQDHGSEERPLYASDENSEND